MQKKIKRIELKLTISLIAITLLGYGCNKSVNIHHEALEGNKKEVISFIENGGDVNQRHEKSGGNLISYAVVSGDTELVSYLISKGANINELDYNGTTALHYAAREHHGEVIKQLVTAGANPNIFASRYNTNNSSSDFPYKGAPLHWALASNNKNTTQKEAAITTLLDVGSNVNAIGRVWVQPPLDLAVRHCDISIVKLLIDAKADVNSGVALIYAVTKDDLEVVRLLIDSGADVNKQAQNTRLTISDPTRKIRSALSEAKSTEMRALLVSAGARK